MYAASYPEPEKKRCGYSCVEYGGMGLTTAELVFKSSCGRRSRPRSPGFRPARRRLDGVRTDPGDVDDVETAYP